MKEFDALFDLADDDLFFRAQDMGKAKPHITCSPNIVVGSCACEPGCRHCKWEYLKTQDPGFTRKRTPAEMVERTKVLMAAGITRIFLASGWMGYETPGYFYDYVSLVKETSALEVYGLFGALSKSCLAGLQQAGLDGMICGLESPNERVYRRFRPGGDSLQDRLNCLRWGRELGLKLWSGFLCGLGENKADCRNGIEMLSTLGLDSVSILPFIPVPNTELWRENAANPWQWARTVAVAGLAMPGANIFSDQIEGLYRGYSQLSGANGFYVFPGKG